MVSELNYLIGTSAQYYKFLNWLEAEFDLYQTEVKKDALNIDYPLVNCVITKGLIDNNVQATLKIQAQSKYAFFKFLNYINEVFAVLKKDYVNHT